MTVENSMIPARPGLAAFYEPREGGRPYREVLAFDDIGRAMVLDGRRGRLVPADKFDGYREVAAHPDGPVVAVMPADGWWHEYPAGEDTVAAEPLVGWGLTSTGYVVPLIWAEDCALPAGPTDATRVYHRDQP